MRTSRRSRTLTRPFLLGLWLIGSFSAGIQAQDYPSPRGFVNDFAGVIQANDSSQMESWLRRLRDQAGIEVVVVTVPSLNGEPLEDYSIGLAQRWGIGGRGTDTGLLLLIAPNERKTRLEVGYGLEGDIPDGLAGEIARRMRPYLQQQAYSQGIRLGVNTIVATLAQKRQIQIEGTDSALAYPGPTRQSHPGRQFPVALIMVIVVIFILASISDSRRGGGGLGGRRRRYAGNSDWVWFPIIFSGGGSGGFGGYRGGGDSWGGDFGGFGGGSFGGGGASDSW